MAYDEELLKRREQREKLRQQRLAEHKKLMTKLVIAAVALVLCAVVIFVVAVSQVLPRCREDTASPSVWVANSASCSCSTA